MKLVTIKFEHYAPKDSESGVAEYVLADDHEAVTDYVDRVHMLGTIRNDDGDVREAWLNNRERPEGAERYGVKQSPDYDAVVVGTFSQLARWTKGTLWDSTEDSYYGVTLWDWSEARDISDADAEVLVRLGIAKRLEGTK